MSWLGGFLPTKPTQEAYGTLLLRSSQARQLCGRSVDNPDSRLEAGHDEIPCHTMDMMGSGCSQYCPLVGEDHGDAARDVQLRRPKKLGEFSFESDAVVYDATLILRAAE